MPVIVINGNDFGKIQKLLDKKIYRCQNTKKIGPIKLKPHTEAIYKFIQEVLELILSFEVNNPSKELSKVLGIFNNAYLVKLKDERKSYKREKKSDNSIKINYVNLLRDTAIKLNGLAEIVGANRFKKSIKNSINDCNSISKNEIDNSKNVFTELSERYKDIMQNVKKYLGDIHEDKYERHRKAVGAVKIDNAVEALSICGHWFQLGEFNHIAKYYKDNFPDGWNLSLTTIPLAQGASRQRMFIDDLVKGISNCASLSNRENIIFLEGIIKETENYALFSNDKFDELLEIAKEALRICNKINTSEMKKNEKEDNFGNSRRDLRAMIDAINKGEIENGNFFRAKKSPNQSVVEKLNELREKSKILSESILSNLKNFNIATGFGIDKQEREAADVFEALKSNY